MAGGTFEPLQGRAQPERDLEERILDLLTRFEPEANEVTAPGAPSLGPALLPCSSND